MRPFERMCDTPRLSGGSGATRQGAAQPLPILAGVSLAWQSLGIAPGTTGRSWVHFAAGSPKRRKYPSAAGLESAPRTGIGDWLLRLLHVVDVALAAGVELALNQVRPAGG